MAFVCASDHASIRKPTHCKFCGQFVCNTCHGAGMVGGCRGQFGCGLMVCGGERIFKYKITHPFVSEGSAPCEACICGIWARKTCVVCHGEGAPNGDCACGRRLKAKHCVVDHASLPSRCSTCEYGNGTHVYAAGARYQHVTHPTHPVKGFCNECYQAAISGVKEAKQDRRFFFADIPPEPTREEMPDENELYNDIETIISILKKYPPGTLSFVGKRLVSM